MREMEVRTKTSDGVKSCSECRCDYCESSKRGKKPPKECRNGVNIRSKSLDSPSAQLYRLDSFTCPNHHHHSCCEDEKKSYYNEWQSERFRSSALERDNERLEARLKETQMKLEREILQQIKISFEWRKTVISLVDENTRLKKLLSSSNITTTTNTISK